MKDILNIENWKDLDSYEGYYQVSDLGRVKRLVGTQSKKERILNPINNGNNYLAVSLCVESKSNRFYIHRLVAQTFIENNEKKDEVNHIDGNRMNNNLSNLEWVTRSENHFHRYKVLNQKGVNFGKTGSKNWRSKKVYKLDNCLNVIESYSAVMEAMRLTGIHESNIRSSIYKNHKAGGFYWKY